MTVRFRDIEEARRAGFRVAEDKGTGDLFAPPAEAAKPGRGRKAPNFKLKAERGKERPEMQAMVARLNVAVVDGWCIHVPNEGLWSFLDMAIPDRAQRGKVIGKLRNAMAKDGFVPRFPDKVLFWRFPEKWREILVAAGEIVPERMACAGTLEAKRPGWTPESDKAWRENPDQHRVLEALRRAGVPFAVVRNADEAVAAARAMGAPVRERFQKDAEGEGMKPEPRKA